MSPIKLLCDTACACNLCAGTVRFCLREGPCLSSSNAASSCPSRRVEGTTDKFHMEAAVTSMSTTPLRVVFPPAHSICQTGCFAASAVCLLRSSLQECCRFACVLLLICACGTALDRAHSPCSISSSSFRKIRLARRRSRNTAGCSRITAKVTLDCLDASAQRQWQKAGWALQSHLLVCVHQQPRLPRPARAPASVATSAPRHAQRHCLSSQPASALSPQLSAAPSCNAAGLVGWTAEQGAEEHSNNSTAFSHH